MQLAYLEGDIVRVGANSAGKKEDPRAEVVG